VTFAAATSDANQKFIVPDELWDSYDNINRAAFKHDVKVKLRQKIKSYTNINVLFDKDTSVMTQSEFER
jgi:hypothetical protein